MPFRTSWTADELMAMTFPETKYAVPGIIAEGLSLLAGPPKVGKSWLALATAIAVAAGTKAFGSIPQQRRRRSALGRSPSALDRHTDGRVDRRRKRIVKKGTGKTKTEAKEKLREILRDYEDGLTLAKGDATVEQAVNDWLKYELSRRDEATYEAGQIMCRAHVIPALASGSSANSVHRMWISGSWRSPRR